MNPAQGEFANEKTMPKTLCPFRIGEKSVESFCAS
jgi:hypothetical protein